MFKIIRIFKEWINKLLLLDLFLGLKTTARQLFADKVTVQYPEENTPKSNRFKGLHALRCYPNGKERCVACKLCEAVCPALAITINPNVNENIQIKEPQQFEIDLSKCMFCGLCEEVCPVNAIVETYHSSYHFESKKEHVLQKEKLLHIAKQHMMEVIKDNN